MDKENRYGKLIGWKLAQSMSFLTFQEVWILNEFNLSEILFELEKFPDYYRFICRPDAPLGKGSLLPRGKTLMRHELKTFFESFNTPNNAAVLLIFQEPSLIVKGRFIERYEISGGIMILFELYKKVSVEFVGRGFDVGDITRGEHCHSRVILPWWIFEGEVNEQLLIEIFNSDIIQSINIEELSYIKSRKVRINSLMDTIGSYNRNTLETAIPLIPEYLSYHIFKALYNNIINKIMLSKDLFSTSDSIGVLCNLFDNDIFVFEIWMPERSIPS